MTTRRNISPSERVAIFHRAGGRCWLCQERIGLAERWSIDHRVPLALGGDEAKGSDNLQPVHDACHRGKTVSDVLNIAKAKRREAKHIGATITRCPLPFGKRSPFKRKIDGSVVRRDEE